MGISSVTLAGIEATVPVAYAATSEGLTSQAYALQVLQTECEGSGTGLAERCRERLQRGGFRSGERRRSTGRAILE